MNKQSAMNKWCDRQWIMFGCLITMIMSIFIALNWNDWTTELKVVAGIAALIPIHVVEEWVFPGGFHYQYNVLLYKSEQPDRYPMCRLSDMITNLEATIGYIILTVVSLKVSYVPTGVIIGSIGFCILEVFLHTWFGTAMYFRFKSKGKTTIYGPGSITAYLGFGFFGVLLCQSMSGRNVDRTEIMIAVILLAWIALLCILIPENLIKKKGNDYFFKSNGYFERFN